MIVTDSLWENNEPDKKCTAETLMCMSDALIYYNYVTSLFLEWDKV